MRLTIYSKPGCHLCEEMKSLVQQATSTRGAVTVEEIDISTDPVLLERYGLEIPVLMIDGKKIAKYRITEAELARMIEARRT